jgi:sarcosine oxidase gamma subunit
MTKKADIGSKRLIALAPDKWAIMAHPTARRTSPRISQLRISMGKSL